MKILTGLLLLVSFVCFGFSRNPPQSKADVELEEVLRQMEATGKTFRSFWARFTQKKYTAILQEFDTPESGIFIYARAKDGSALLRQEAVKPATRILTIKGGVATIFQPGLKQAQVVNLGKNKDKAEYLALGLGQSPSKLRETFEIKLQGSEVVGGTSCAIINLKPRNPGAAAYFSSISLWVKKSNSIPIQQRLQEPNGDYLLVSFTEEKVNSRIPTSAFEQRLPQGVDIQRIH